MKRRNRRKKPRTTETAGLPTDFNICGGDPLVSCFNHISTPYRTPVMVTTYLFFFLGVPAIMAGMTGVFTAPHFTQLFRDDVHRFPPFALVVHLLTAITGAPSTSWHSTQNPTVIPFLRDYALILVMGFMAAHMALIRKQWELLSRALFQLWNSDNLSHARIPRNSLVKLSRKYNPLFRLKLWRVLSLSLALALALGCENAGWKYGIYAGLNVPLRRGWQRAAYLGWWANPVSHPLNFAYRFFLIVFVIYYMIRHNIVGICAVAMSVEVLKRPNSSKGPILKLQTHHLDGLGGLRILRDIMLLVYISIMLMGASLLLVYYYLPEHVSSVMLPFYFIFFGLNPLYIAVPLWLFRRGIRASKTLQIKRLIAERNSRAGHKGGEAKFLLDEYEIKALQDVPELLFSHGKIIFFIVTYLIPILLFVNWLFSNLLTRAR